MKRAIKFPNGEYLRPSRTSTKLWTVADLGRARLFTSIGHAKVALAGLAEAGWEVAGTEIVSVMTTEVPW